MATPHKPIPKVTSPYAILALSFISLSFLGVLAYAMYSCYCSAVYQTRREWEVQMEEKYRIDLCNDHQRDYRTDEESNYKTSFESAASLEIDITEPPLVHAIPDLPNTQQSPRPTPIPLSPISPLPTVYDSCDLSDILFYTPSTTLTRTSSNPMDPKLRPVPISSLNANNNTGYTYYNSTTDANATSKVPSPVYPSRPNISSRLKPISLSHRPLNFLSGFTNTRRHDDLGDENYDPCANPSNGYHSKCQTRNKGSRNGNGILQSEIARVPNSTPDPKYPLKLQNLKANGNVFALNSNESTLRLGLRDLNLM